MNDPTLLISLVFLICVIIYLATTLIYLKYKASEATEMLVTYSKICETHGLCVACGKLASHDIDEPFAHCACHTSEWYTLTPYMRLESKLFNINQYITDRKNLTKSTKQVIDELKALYKESDSECTGKEGPPGSSVPALHKNGAEGQPGTMPFNVTQDGLNKAENIGIPSTQATVSEATKQGPESKEELNAELDTLKAEIKDVKKQLAKLK